MIHPGLPRWYDAPVEGESEELPTDYEATRIRNPGGVSPSLRLAAFLSRYPDWEGVEDEPQLECPFYHLNFEVGNWELTVGLYDSAEGGDPCLETSAPFTIDESGTLTSETEAGKVTAVLSDNTLKIEIAVETISIEGWQGRLRMGDLFETEGTNSAEVDRPGGSPSTLEDGFLEEPQPQPTTGAFLRVRTSKTDTSE